MHYTRWSTNVKTTHVPAKRRDVAGKARNRRHSATRAAGITLAAAATAVALAAAPANAGTNTSNKVSAAAMPMASSAHYWSVTRTGAAAWGYWWYGSNRRLYVSGTIADTKGDHRSAVARLVFWGGHAAQRREEDPSVGGKGKRHSFSYNSKYRSAEVQACTKVLFVWSCSSWRWLA